MWGKDQGVVEVRSCSNRQHRMLQTTLGLHNDLRVKVPPEGVDDEKGI
jgi:hypothetical protein